MTAPPATRRPLAPRSVVAVVLAVLSAIFVALAVDAFWFQSTIGDADAFVDRVAPLPQQRAVSSAMALGVVDALGEQGVLDEQLSRALPDQLDFLAPTFGELTGQLVFDATRALIETDAFAGVWRIIAASTHRSLMESLDEPGRAQDLVFNLDAAATLLLDRLELAGISVSIADDVSLGEWVIVPGGQLELPSRVARSLQTALWVFPLVAGVLLVAAVLIDIDRLRPVQIAGFSSGGAMLLGAALLALARSSYIAGGQQAIDAAARAVVWDALTQGYLIVATVAAVSGVLVGTAAWWYRQSERRSKHPVTVG